MRKILLLSFALLSFLVKAQEGTKQLMPNETDKLQIQVPATYNTESRIYIYLKAGEKMHLGMNPTGGSTNYQLNDPSDNIVIPSTPMPTSGAGYISTYQEAISGPEGVYLNGVQTSTADGYTPIVYTATTTGNHYISFGSQIYLDYFDITVTDASGNIIVNPDQPNKSAGRVWSYKWNFNTTSFTQYPVNADFYVFTSDEFVNKVKYKMYPYVFSFAVNSYGIDNTKSNPIEKAQSYNGNRSNTGEYKIFLNDPDHDAFTGTSLPPPMLKVWLEDTKIYDYDYDREPQLLNINAGTVTLEKNGAACTYGSKTLFKIETNISGFTTILLDLNNDGVYTSGSVDRYLNVDLNVGTNYVIWDFKDDSGNAVSDGVISASATFLGRGPAHFPIFDAEALSGIETASVRPFNKLGPTLYWDDSKISAVGEWGDNTGKMDETVVTQLKINAGIERIWTYFGNNGGFSNGNENTMNSWFNAIDLGMPSIPINISTNASKCENGDAPIIADIYKETPINASLTFSASDFENKFFDVSQSLNKIQIVSLPDPAHGVLRLSGVDVAVNDEILQSDISNLVFIPTTDWGGETTFEYNASNGTYYADDSDFVYIKVNTDPVISDIGDQSICANTDLTDLPFTVNDAETDVDDIEVIAYSHNTDIVSNQKITVGGSGSNRTISITPNTDAAGSAIVYVKADDGYSEVIKSFTLYIGPSIEVIGDTTICSGNDLNLSAEEPGATYLWTDPNGATYATQDLNIASGSVSYGTYSLTVTKGGCEHSNDFEVSQSPLVSFSGETSACAGNDITLSATETVATSYTWTNGSLTYNTKILNDDVSTLSSSNWTLKITKEGCTNTSAPFEILANNAPAVKTTTGSTVEAGENGVVTITSSESNIVYKAYINGTEVGSGIGDGNDISINILPSRLLIGANTVELIASEGGCETPLSDVTITVNQPKISVDDVSVNEGNTGTKNMQFVVSLSYYSQSDITVDYSTQDNSATVVDGDYQSITSGTITFESGETSKTINVTINGDKKAELDEALYLNLTNAVNAVIEDAQGVGTISNDDNAPLLTATDKNVSEGTTAVETVSATDADAGDSKTYSISGTDASFFSIGESSGVLTFASAPDYENPADANTDNVYVLNITVTDGGSNTDTKTINVTVTNVNDNSPSISNATATIAENAANNTAVVNIDDDNTSSDNDADGETISYSITAGNGDGIFEINSSTGAITVVNNSKLDYETTTSYSLTVQATDGTNTDNATVSISVTNVNDNSPVISNATATIAENAANNSAVVNIDDDNTSSDNDADGETISYSITAGNGDGIFGINSSTGAITVVNNSKLDYETTTSYSLTVQATDGTNTDNATVSISVTNVNDNSPVISNATATIAENAANNSAVVNIDDDNTSSDNDADGETISYSITAGNGDGIFGINSSTGAITVVNNSKLDYETTTSYSLTVQATDGTNTDNATVSISVTNVNDNSPVISNATATIAENAANNSAVVNIDDDNTSSDNDADGETISYSITAGNGDGIFEINSSTGAITVVNNSKLDYETTTSYSLTVQATDGTNTDNATVSISVTNVNDNSPVISNATATIAENAANNSAVVNIDDDNTSSDNDADGETISYSITAGNGDGIFEINSSTGAITVVNNSKLDYETATSYILTVQATDGTNTDNATVSISVTNVNDNSPVISNATATIAENAANNTAVVNIDDDNTSSDQDADGETISYSITAGNGDGIFEINSSTGAITVVNNSKLDYETTTSYSLILQATDGTNTDNATVSVTVTNVNDNSPVISNATATIAENAANNTAVVNIDDDNTSSDQDADGETISYSITAGNGDGIFEINTSTGAITVVNNSKLDYETTTSYSLTVQATDGTNTDNATVSVTVTNVNDNSPVISNASATIAENAANNSAVVNIDDDNTSSDLDADGETISYSITAGNGDGIFEINSSTGAITVVNNSKLDYETTTSYSLTIQATDGTNTDNATVSISVTNVNDNSPVISNATATIAENAANNTAVVNIDDDNTSSDLDADGETISYSITAGNGDGVFGINSSTGAITVVNNSKLDYETTTSYSLSVQATDGTNTDNATVTVTVTNVNDNSPEISNATATIAENAANNTAVVNIDDDNTSSDLDADGETISYSITAGNGDGIFGINSSTGAITVVNNSKLDYETTPSYSLTVQATDGTNTDNATVSISVTNVNDNSPVISNASATIAENAANNTAVVNIDDDNTSSDNDADGETISYSITAGNGDGIFEINSSTGAITVVNNSKLDYETTISYSLTVQATDGTNTDNATVTVTVTDVNDNNPVLSASDKSVSEGTTAVETVSATDADAGDSKTYSISGTDASFFSIGATTGVLTFASAPDYENPADANTDNVYVLDVTVTDGGSNTDTKTINVTVTDVNDNNPVLSASDKSVSEGTTAVETVSAADADAGDSKTYSISGTDASFFNIGATTGVLTFTNAPDYENPADANTDNVYVLDVTVTDGSSHTDTKTINVTVTNENDNDPVINVSSTTVPENYSRVVVDASSSDLDVNDTENYSLSGDDAALFNINASTGELTFKVAPDYENPSDSNTDNVYELTIIVTDGAGNTDSEAITITVTNVNDSMPVAFADEADSDKGAVSIIDVLSNDTGLEDGNLVVSIPVQPADGVVIVNEDNTITITPNTDFVGDITFDYQVCDGEGDCSTSTVTVTVEETDNDGDGILNIDEGDGDTDGDGILDKNDPDSDNDGILDSEEGTGDADGDGIPNYKDSDSDGDGIPDVEEGSEDIDGDGVGNYLDLDSDGDGIPDSEEGNMDSDSDGTPDYKDTDSDNDGILDLEEGTGDADGDGIPNYKDSDSDGDGIPDVIEGSDDIDGDGDGNYLDLDSDDDGIPDSEEGNVDSDNDGTPDYQDTDSDNDGILDEVEGSIDSDNDGTPDYTDTDSDGDGIPDVVEGSDDVDNDGEGNYLDLDSDDDGIPDSDEGYMDSDNDGTPDYQDTDSDNDGVPDNEESTGDCDNDGVPDRIDEDKCYGEDELILYEGFSPNNDGDNDTYNIPWLYQFNQVSIEIFNRWGNVVYKQTKYDNNWNGESNVGFSVGKELPVGTYYYIIYVRDIDRKITGYIYLNR